MSKEDLKLILVWEKREVLAFGYKGVLRISSYHEDTGYEVRFLSVLEMLS